MNTSDIKEAKHLDISKVDTLQDYVDLIINNDLYLKSEQYIIVTAILSYHTVPIDKINQETLDLIKEDPNKIDIKFFHDIPTNEITDVKK